MSLREEYHTLWNWLLDKGIILATFIINFFLATIVVLVMVALHFYLKLWGKH
jgi:hypothetical protein